MFPAFMNLGATSLTNPIETVSHSANKKSTGRMHPQVVKNVNFKQIADPIDIDDDISEDHAADSVAQQLRELEGMNKYM